MLKNTWHIKKHKIIIYKLFYKYIKVIYLYYLMKVLLFIFTILPFINCLVCPETYSSYGKTDCGYVGINQNECISKGCCWQPTSDNSPYCTYPNEFIKNNYYNPNLNSSVPFLNEEIITFFNYFILNIDINSTGSVAAAPDLNTPGGSYFYHWARDGGLTIDTLQFYTNSTFSYKFSNDYAKWIKNIQSKADPNNIDIRIEPKYIIPSGTAYTGSWCRPQNDGPGLQAIALINSAISTDITWPIIKYNLDYIINGYNDKTCDLWEEIISDDFFWNRVTMAKALSLGSKLAGKLGYKQDESNWKILSNLIKSNIYTTHWNGYYFYESNNRPVDGAVIVGLNDGYDSEDNFLNPLSYEVASTIYYYNLVFSSEYPINKYDMSYYGILYGRYPGDVYAGGNPWILTTAALASLMYRIAIQLNNGKTMEYNTINMWKNALNLNEMPNNLVKLFQSQGDCILKRLKIYVEPYNFHMYEQIDKNNGKQISAYDLTWSYAEVLNSLKWREQLN
jgi:glucoamylase